MAVVTRARKHTLLLTALILCMACLFVVTPALASEYKLEVVGTPKVYVVTGGTADLEVKLKNTTSETVELINMWEPTVVGEGDEAFTPYVFQDRRESPEPENAIVELNQDLETTYAIAAGQTATFHVCVRVYDMDPGTYNHEIQFAHWHHVIVEDDEEGTSKVPVLDELYSARIPVTTVVYNPPGAALEVGTGTIDLTSSELTFELPFYIKNVSPTVDAHTGAKPDITVVDGSSMTYRG